MARHPELEAAILADRDDPELYRVYGDWLEQQGDPRGALIALHDAGAKSEARQYLEAHPELVPQVRSTWGFRFEWNRGFIGAVEIDDPSADDFAAVIQHPSCALLSSLQVEINGDFAAEVIGQIASQVSPVRDLVIRHTVIPFEIRPTPPLDDELWDHVPRLRTLTLSNPGLFATLRHPALESLKIEGQDPFRNNEPWWLPRLRVLAWSNADGGALVIKNSLLPELRELRLFGKLMPLFKQGDLFELLPQLEVLALPRQAIAGNNLAAIEKLRKHAPQLDHLRELSIYSQTTLPDPSILEVLPNLKWG